jgi:hypothetical protein
LSKKDGKAKCSCGAKLRPDGLCKRGHVTRASIAANAEKRFRSMPGPAYVTKAAAADPRSVSWCGAGHPNPRGATFCISCPTGTLMPGKALPPISAIGKSAAADSAWAHLRYSWDSGEREIYYQNKYGQN